MKYFTVNQRIENEIKVIKKEIYLSMNGICSEQIVQNGIKYKQNFGVSWNRIKEIAKNHEQNIELSERLWYMKIRETMLIAPLLAPIEEVKISQIEEWLKELSTIEVAEILSMCLLSKLNYSFKIAEKHITNDNLYIRCAAINTAARCIKQYSIDECKTILSKLQEDDINNKQLSLAIMALLENIMLHKAELTNDIKMKIEPINANIYTHILELFS